MRWLLALLFVTLSAGSTAAGERLEIESQWVPLRSGPTREWTIFPEQAPARWERKLPPLAPNRAYTLRLRQQDVKQAWRVLLNGRPLGELVLDERALRWEFDLPREALAAGENLLRVEPRGQHATSDDIRIGGVELHATPPADERWTPVAVEVVDPAGGVLPCCLTIVDGQGALVPLGNRSQGPLAVRTGIVYTATGRAVLLVPREPLTVYATRGFEYSQAQAALAAHAPGPHACRLTLRREVPVPGHVACDPHIHTVTFSGHGDATIDERMITLAGEGLELPIATDHNVFVDYEAHAARVGVRQYFTPVVGNEVTTKVGHFNIFPAAAGSRLPDHHRTDWNSIFDELAATPGVKVCILNHARDLHSGMRPFGPERYNAAVAEQLDGWPLRFNALEILNSGATQSDPLQLTRDWMALLNRGLSVTPVGSSDSHDVARFIVGQGRTYIRCDDRDPAKIDLPAAIESFRAGRVLVSYGLLAELEVDDRFLPGDFAPQGGDSLRARITVSAPHWIAPDRVQLYGNGQLLREVALPPPGEMAPGGERWRETWQLPRPKHDLHLVAVALGPGIVAPAWATARPYQPTSPDLKMQTLGISGAVWVDGDGDGRKSAAHDYAVALWKATGPADLAGLIGRLADYDAAVATHAFHLARAAGIDWDGAPLRPVIAAAPAQVRQGLEQASAAWRASHQARAAQ